MLRRIAELPRPISDETFERAARSIVEGTGYVRGKEHVLLIGDVGSGLSKLSNTVARTMPPIGDHDILTRDEVRAIYSTAGLLPGPSHVTCSSPSRGFGAWVPLRRPHYSVSPRGVLGDGGRPGEVSLAHGGVLVIDDVLEWSTAALRAIAPVIREKRVWNPGRGWDNYMPADFLLIVTAYHHGPGEGGRIDHTALQAAGKALGFSSLQREPTAGDLRVIYWPDDFVYTFVFPGEDW